MTLNGDFSQVNQTRRGSLLTEEHQQLLLQQERLQQEKLQQDIQATDDPPYNSPGQLPNQSPGQFSYGHTQLNQSPSFCPPPSSYNPGSPKLYRKSSFNTPQQIPSHLINHPAARLPQHLPNNHPHMNTPYNQANDRPARFTSPKFSRKSQPPGSGSPRLIRKSQQPQSQIPSLVKTPYNQPKYYHNPGQPLHHNPGQPLHHNSGQPLHSNQGQPLHSNPGQPLHSNPGQPLHNMNSTHLPTPLSSLMVNTQNDSDPKRLAQDLYDLGFRQVSSISYSYV